MCLEKFGEWHKNPVNAFLHLVALVVLIYGLWMHDWTWIIIAIVIAIVGHLIQAMTRKKPATVEKVKIKKRKMRKKAALELSIGTIVVIVIAITMLIFGIVFVRKIMCSGIIITDQISAGVENELKNLFGANDYGVKCMGEEGQEIKLGDGGRRQVICIINTDTQAEYKLTVKNIESLRGASTTTVNKWVLKQDWKGIASAGKKTVTVLILNVPQKVSATTLEIEIEEENLDSGTKETHTSIIDVVHVGGFKTAIC